MQGFHMSRNKLWRVNPSKRHILVIGGAQWPKSADNVYFSNEVTPHSSKLLSSSEIS